MLVGDGECQAGIIWEGAVTAAKYHLANLTVLVDDNGVQLDGPVAEVMPIEPLGDKWRACGWHVLEVNGHSIREVAEGLEYGWRSTRPANGPDRPYHQGQRRIVHGESLLLARQCA